MWDMQEGSGWYLITGLLIWKPRSKQTKQNSASKLLQLFQMGQVISLNKVKSDNSEAKWCSKSEVLIFPGNLDVCNRPIVDKGPEENWDKPIRQQVALDELHMLTGGFQKLYYVGKTHFSSMDTWARLSGSKSQ